MVQEGKGVKDKTEEHRSGVDVDRHKLCQIFVCFDGHLTVDDLAQTFSG